MIFSKSFGYALRSVLYVALVSDEKEKTQLDKIAVALNVPRYFLGKVMNRLVKEGILSSLKGHKGGFFINETTLGVSLSRIMDITGENEQFDTCVLRQHKCNVDNPCPLHKQAEAIKEKWQSLLSTTTVEDLLKKDTAMFIRGIAAI